MIKCLLIIPVIILLLNGCSSSPREVKASIALVENKSVLLGKKISAKYRNDLESSMITTIHHNQYHISVGPFFTSSLGQDCRSLNIVDMQRQTSLRVVCAEKKQYIEQVRVWSLMPDVVRTEQDLEL